jgi:hypothetical protein
MENNPDRVSAERRVRAKLSFVGHAATYILVMTMLAVINLTTTPSHLWFIWPLLGWGVGLVWHGIGTFMLSKGARTFDRLVERELRR